MATGSWKNWLHSFKNDIGLLNEKMSSNFQISIKEKKRELRTATEATKLALTSEPNCASHFIKYATTLYNEVPKSIQEAEKYCAVVPKLKRYLLDKILARSLSNLKKGWTWVWCVKRKTYNLSPYSFVFDNSASVHYIAYVFIQFHLIQQFQFTSSVSIFISVILLLSRPIQSTSTNSACFLGP